MVTLCFFAAMIIENRKIFLESVAEELVKVHGHQLQDVVVVLPSRRSRKFLLHHLSQKLQRPFWAPQCIIMPQLVSALSGERLAGKMESLCVLYDVHLNASAHPEEIQEFFRWGKILLNDFQDVDASLTDPAALFSDLRDVREIENWSFNQTDLSNGQMAFLKFWTEIGELYQGFAHEQQNRGIRTYHAMVKFLVNEPQQRLGNLNATELIFAGISSFSKAEEKLVYRLMELIPCRIFHDLDEYYVNEKMHEAGAMIRKSGLPVHSFVGQYFKSIPKSVFITECSTATSEVLALVNDLKNLNQESLEDTAVILADLTSLDLFMNTLSAQNIQVNVALGIQVKSHAYWRWLNVVFKIYTQKSGRGIHYRELLEVLRLLAKEENPEDKSILKHIGTSHLVYYRKKELEHWLTGFSAYENAILLFDQQVECQEFLNRVLLMLPSFPIEDTLSQTVVPALQRICLRLQDMLSKYSYFNQPEALALLFEEVSGDESVHFEGDPVNGLQIMDLVESRALDFSHLYVVGANEDHLPGKGDYQSMIPFDLRQHYGLPMPQDRESMYAYNFYRLMQRAENIHFYHASVSTEFRGTEKSRYITQLEYALPTLNPLHSVHHRKMKIQEITKHIGSIQADSFSEGRLDALFEAGISPSAINKFINCPLDFYYRYILGLGENDTPEENISVADFGTMIHDVLEDFYKPHIGSYPTEAEFRNLAENAEAHLLEALKKRNNVQQVDSGFNYLALRIAEDMLKKYAHFELSRLNALALENILPQVAAVESVLWKQIDHEKYDWKKPVAMKGKADRIDFTAGKYQIIDYKTGKVDEKNTSFRKNAAELFLAKDKGKQLQLATYILMYAEQNIHLDNIEAGFYSFRNFKSGYQNLESAEASVSEFIPQFESAFMEWVKSVYETEIFEHNPDSKFCQFCV
ncbi:MAG: PD-(D/E)XK nuclease family protein [Flavobacteriales bacterium]|nr:PD-(D/E)XK nuclease family protein [Flavobacteriales bacterium]